MPLLKDRFFRGQSRGGVLQVSVFTERLVGVEFLQRMVCSHGLLKDARTNQGKVCAVSVTLFQLREALSAVSLCVNDMIVTPGSANERRAALSAV